MELALELAAEPGHFLSAMQVGITLIGILSGAFGEATFAAGLSGRIALRNPEGIAAAVARPMRLLAKAAHPRRLRELLVLIPVSPNPVPGSGGWR